MFRSMTLSALLMIASLLAHAQDALRIMGPSEPAAGFSTTARAVQQAMVASGAAKSVDVFSVPGEGGLAGLRQFVAEARGDRTRLMITGYTTLGSILVSKSAVTLDDVTPIARLTSHDPFGVLVAADSPFRDARQLAAALKADPSAISWSAGSVGGAGHTTTAMFAVLSGVDPSKLEFNVALAGAALDLLLKGTVQVALVSSYAGYEKELKAGRVRLLGVTSAQRWPGIDAPTLTEQGIPLVFENWRGIVAAPGITAAEREALSRAVEKMVRSQAWKDILVEKNWTDAYLGGADFERFLAAERVNAERAYRAAGMVK